MAAVMTAPGCPAFESLTTAITATAIWTPAAIAAKRPLEARAGVAADAGGIARVIFPRRGASRSARFAGQQEFNVFGNGLAAAGSDDFGIGVHRFDFGRFFDRWRCGRKLFLFRFGGTQFAFGLFLFFQDFLVLAQGCDMFGGFLCDICGEVRTISGAAGFHFGNLLRAEARGVLSLRFLGFLFGIFVFEDGAADDGIGLGLCRGFFVLGFHEIGGQSGDLIFV